MVEYTWKDFARALALAESLVDVASEEPPPSDAALRDEVCMARAVVAADIIIERLELELAAARKVASCLHGFATAHEKWEAALIMDDAAWQGGMAALPTLTETLYAGMMELQRQRADALAAYRATKERSAS